MRRVISRRVAKVGEKGRGKILYNPFDISCIVVVQKGHISFIVTEARPAAFVALEPTVQGALHILQVLFEFKSLSLEGIPAFANTSRGGDGRKTSYAKNAVYTAN